MNRKKIIILNNKIKSLSVKNASDDFIGKTVKEIQEIIDYQEEHLNNFLIDLLDDLGDIMCEEFGNKYYTTAEHPLDKIELISNKFKELLIRHLED
tara:strand:+ start:592 stop:879 length:288 start_codon:yes stop_codon:yes gene_type:complete